ncbi:MAG: tRNA pseudouridine(38-40) synthase TruA [Actinomycetes bacterium]
MTSPPAQPGDGGLARLRLDLAYDGAGFSGWARQPGRRTVQGVVEEGLARVLRLDAPPSVTCAGRTDAGVHARGQVAHVDLPRPAVAETGMLEVSPAGDSPAGDSPVGGSPVGGSRASLVRRLRGVLPPDVRVSRVGLAPEGFDARFSALWRRYAYRVSDSESGPDPLRRHDVLGHRRSLDLDLMNAAASGLTGEHDFAAFCRRREGGTTVRRLLDLRWDRGEAGLAVATVRADAFCHAMVRSLVGAMLAVGEGRRPPSWPAEVLAVRVRDSAVTVVGPHGLTLEEVRYPPDAELAGRARETRRVRVPSPASGDGSRWPPDGR